MNKTMWYIFLLAAFTLVLVYYAGFKSDIQTVAPYVGQLYEIFQGRIPGSGQFPSYPATATA